jgi:hypothetical protein
MMGPWDSKVWEPLFERDRYRHEVTEKVTRSRLADGRTWWEKGGKGGTGGMESG